MSAPGRADGGPRGVDLRQARLRLSGWVDGRLEQWLADAIDSRVRSQVARGLEGIDRRFSALAVDPAIRELVAREIARQTPADQPDERELNRRFTTDVLLGAGRSNDRTLSAGPYRDLVAEISALTGADNLTLPLQRAYQALLDAESRGLGRIAGTTYNILGKLVVPPLLQPAPGPLLEIGTLFGLFSSALVRQFQRVGDFRSLTVVDPFVGTQVQDGLPGRLDRTGTPVTEETARRNFAVGGLRADEVRLVRGYSTDPEVRSEVADRGYGVVVIDGDHSAAGVYRDLWWVQEVVVPGGIVVMDDWGDPSWPGVAAAGRRYLADGGRLELLGRAATSAYLRQP